MANKQQDMNSFVMMILDRYASIVARRREAYMKNFTNTTVSLASIANIPDEEMGTAYNEYLKSATDAAIKYSALQGRTNDALLNLIAKSEGTDDSVIGTLSKQKYNRMGKPQSGYDITLGYGAYHESLEKPLTQMTVGEVKKLQRAMLNNPKNKLNSSAVGRYQIITSNFDWLQEKTGVSDNDLFTPEVQDKWALALMGDSHLNYKMGTLSREGFQKKLASIWDSLPYQGVAGWAGTKRHMPGVLEDEFWDVLDEIKYEVY